MNDSSWSSLDPASVSLRMVVCDMDGTLLDGQSQIPEGFWELCEVMNRKGVVFVPASSRQLATLASMFSTQSESRFSFDFIAENGNVVEHAGERIWQTKLPESLKNEVLSRVRNAQDSGRDIGLVMCAADRAYVERSDQAFLDEVALYYKSLDVVGNLENVDDEFLKYAVYDFSSIESIAESHFGDLPGGFHPIVSGEHWIDIMDPSINKGKAVRALQDSLGISAEETAVFGDYLNDAEMMDCGEYSFAMDNAHPRIKELARYSAPSNTDHGVIQVLTHILG